MRNFNFLILLIVLFSINISFSYSTNFSKSNGTNKKKRIKELKLEIKALKKELSYYSYNEETDLMSDKKELVNNEIKREKKETRREIKNLLKTKLSDIDVLIENSETKEEYESLKLHRKEVRTKYLDLRRKYKDDSFVETKVEESVEEFRSILKNLEPNALTFVTNGTRISKQGSESQYFFDNQKKANSTTYTEEFGTLFNSNYAVFLNWEGKNNDIARRNAANKFVNQIKFECFRYSIKTSKQIYNIPINLVGHSHGGNIMIMVANKLAREGYSVQFLLTLNTPQREYLLNYPVEHVQLYSYDDNVQKIGGWDFDLLWQDLDYKGAANRKFDSAININLNYFLDYETYVFFTRDFLSLYKTGRDYYHQITRYLGIVEKIISP